MSGGPRRRASTSLQYAATAPPRAQTRRRWCTRSSGYGRPRDRPRGSRQAPARCLEIAGVLQPAVPNSAPCPAQPPDRGLVGFGHAVDIGSDLDADRPVVTRLVAGDLDSKSLIRHCSDLWPLVGSTGDLGVLAADDETGQQKDERNRDQCRCRVGDHQRIK